MILKVLEQKHMPQIIIERNKVMETLRTPMYLNENMQDAYFQDVICNRDSKTRYWAVYESMEDYAYKFKNRIVDHKGIKTEFIGYGGVENIQFENGIGELSLLVFEQYRKKGYGKEAVSMFLDNAFNYLGLKNVYLECYYCNKSGIAFWEKILAKYNGYKTILPNRKYYAGDYHDSLYGNISKENFNECK